MKSYSDNQISLLQFILIISGIQVSVPILSLPRRLAETAGTDGWISLIIGWALSEVASIAIILVMKNHPDDTLPDLILHYIGTWAGKAIALVLALYFCLLTLDGLARTVLITKSWLLPNTHVYTIMILLLVPAYTIARHGPRILGRYAQIVVLMSLWIPLMYLVTLKNAHWLHLLPILKEGWRPVFSAVQATIYPFLGMAAAFILYPFLRRKEKAVAGILISNTLTLLTYLFVTVICFIHFSPDEITEYNEPVISVLQAIEFTFIERIEVPFIAFYLFIFSLVWIPAMYLTTFCSSWLFGLQDNRSHLRSLCLIIAVGAYFFSPTFKQSNRLEAVLFNAGLGIEYLFPVCLLVYLWIHNRFQRRNSL
ncbi:endospore germination permease [Paenibacillus sepulcri]|uniref:Endospore germination permease n=1 Tax=Paenibacillus sepulcri TaxID=359917 RepID=A0ABS7BZH0_9BACL|nr:endospore germination permease [Paenibacillus sepulcri]